MKLNKYGLPRNTADFEKLCEMVRKKIGIDNRSIGRVLAVINFHVTTQNISLDHNELEAIGGVGNSYITAAILSELKEVGEKEKLIK